MTLTPELGLAYGTTYTATVSGAKDTDGDPDERLGHWSFTTDPLQPAVSSHTPASGATGVAVSTAPDRHVQRGGAVEHDQLHAHQQLRDFGAGGAVLQQLQRTPRP